eukprot:4050906-Pyramimonas_sp.AAC.1
MKPTEFLKTWNWGSHCTWAPWTPPKTPWSLRRSVSSDISEDIAGPIVELFCNQTGARGERQLSWAAPDLTSSQEVEGLLEVDQCCNQDAIIGFGATGVAPKATADLVDEGSGVSRRSTLEGPKLNSREPA